MKSSSVSLCKSCYCMTKTIDGRCGKCKAGKSKGFTKNQKVVYKEPDEKGGKMIKKLDYTFKEADIDQIRMKINEIIDYLQDPENIIKSYNDLLDRQHEGEVSRGECTCKLENNYHFTGCKKHKCYIDGFCDLCSKHKYSDPPEPTRYNGGPNAGELVYPEHEERLYKDSESGGFVEVTNQYVSKEKIKRVIKLIESKNGVDGVLDDVKKSLGLGD